MEYLKNNTDTLQTPSGSPLYITFLRHASLLFTFEGNTFYVDPLGEYMKRGDWPKADHIFVTHEHFDHFDKKCIAEISKQDTRVVLNPNCVRLLGYGEQMKNGDSLDVVQRVSVKAVPAYNITPGHLQFHPKGRDNGYVFTFGGLRVYVSGDTEDIPELKELYDLDVAFLPVNQPYTMTLEQADRAARQLKPKVFYPYHFSETPVERLVESLKDVPQIKVELREMQ